MAESSSNMRDDFHFRFPKERKQPKRRLMPDKIELPSQDALEAEIPPPPAVKKQKLTLMDHNYHVNESLKKS